MRPNPPPNSGGPPGSLARFGWREEDAKPQLVLVSVRLREYGLSLWCQGRHALSATRAYPHQDQAANQTGVGDRQRLRDEAAKRETHDVDRHETKRLDE